MTKGRKVFAALALLAAACGGRTTAATQPAPADYDPTKNDPKAVEAVDAMVAAMGGDATWIDAKQIQWDMRVDTAGEPVAIYSHAWDRWNARHRFESTNVQSYKEAEELNDPDKVSRTVGMYKLFERDGGAAYHDGNELSAEDRKKFIATGFERWGQDSYMLTFPYKLKDPGVYLTYEGENSDKLCPDTCDVVKVTFHPDVQKSVKAYVVNINRKTHLPEVLEIELADKPGRMAYTLSEWQDAGGLKFPGKLDNVGARDMGSPEVWTLSNVRVSGEPDDSLYIPRVQ